MAKRNQIERGYRHEWARRLGHQGMPTEFAGARRAGVTNPANKPRRLENARLQVSGPITERPGQSKDGAVMSGSVMGVFDPTLTGGTGGIFDPTRNFSRLLVMANAGRTLGSYTPEEAAAFQSVAETGTTYTFATIFRHDDGNLYLGTRGYQPAATGSYFLDLLKITPWIPPGLGLISFCRFEEQATASRLITSMASLMGTLYIGVGTESTANILTTKTYSFDGTQVTELDSVTWGLGDGECRPIVIPYREQLVVAHYNGTVPPTTKYKVRHRNYAGAWSDGAMTDFDPAGSQFSAFDAIVYKDRLYVAGVGNRFGIDGATRHAYIMVYDGTTWSIARNIATSLYATSLRIFNGLLYYGHSHAATSGGARIGTFDGTTWADNHFDFVLGFSGTGGKVRAVADMYEFQGNLCVAVQDLTGSVTGVYQSNGLITVSGWTKIASAGILTTFGTYSITGGVPRLMTVMP